MNVMVLAVNTPLMLILVSVMGMAIGLFLFFNPAQTIELQRKFYEKINWRIEPISMSQEIRNTRIMGIFLIGAAVATIIYSLVN
jgi:hypothetical protein